MRGRYIATVVGLMVIAVAATPALAGKGGNGGGGGGSTPTAGANSITLNGTASFGNAANFTVVDPPVSGLPEMSVTCSQNGKTVYGDVQMMSGSSPYSPTFTLYSQTWAAAGGGAADCVADLYYYTWQGHTETGVVYLASTSFTASA